MSIQDPPPLPYTSLDVDMHSAHADVDAEALKIEADYATRPGVLTVEEAWWGTNSAIDDARVTRSKEDEHRYLVRLAAWALVGVRAGVRAKGGGA